MNVLNINSYYSDSHFYKNLYDKMVEIGISVVVYIPVLKNYKIEKDMGHYSVISNVYNNLERIFFYPKHKKIFYDIQNKLQINKFDLIHAHSLFSNGFIAYSLYHEYNIPYIVAVRNTDINLFFKKMFHLRSLGIKILKYASKIIFLSYSYMEIVLKSYVPNYLRDEIEKKCIVIPNGVDEFWLDNKFDGKKCCDRNKIRLIYVGVLNKNKNANTTLKSIDMLLKKGFRIEFTLIGKACDKRILKKVLDKKYTNYVEHISKEELINYYRHNDIFIMPSKNETFGIVYAEALSQGLPIIYTKGQGFDRQFAEGYVGYSVKYNSREEISNAIIKILDNYSELSNNCENCAKKFSWDLIARQYREIYMSITDNI